MSAASSEVIKQLALDNARKAIRKKLANPDSTPIEKLFILANNQHDRLYVLKWLQKFTLENEFKKKPDFYTNEYHYDWWVFPMFVPSEWRWQDRNYHASVSIGDVQTILKDGEFVMNYVSCIGLYIQALKENGWNDYPVRYARMLQSISLFLHVANTTESPVSPTVKKKLLEAATASMEYAKEQFFSERYKDYPLFMNGLEKTSTLLLIAETLKTAPAPAIATI